jgi:hypothetical protein
MFCRFRSSTNRLQVSLISTARVEGKVRHEHVASFGSIAEPPSLADRVEFWRGLHERLAKLSNRIDSEQAAKIMASIHDRIPMPTPEDQRSVQREAAEADAKFWSNLAEMQADHIEGHKELVATAENTITLSESQRANAVVKAAEAKQRIERIDRGEDVPGSLKPVDVEAICKAAGLTTDDIRRAILVAKISEVGAWEEMRDETHKRRERSERAAIRAVAKRHGL